MIVAIPVRDGSPDQPEHLRYVLRTIERNLPHEDVVLVGHKPAWYRGHHIPTTQNGGEKHVNMGLNLRAAATRLDRFVWWSDDVYILKPSTPAIYARPETVDEMIARCPMTSWRKLLVSQRDILRSWGFDTSKQPCGESHYPMPMESDRVLDLLARIRKESPKHPCGFFKGLYSAGLDPVISRDPKIVGVNRHVDPEAVYLSTSPTVYRQGEAGRYLRETFPNPSTLEIEGA